MLQDALDTPAIKDAPLSPVQPSSPLADTITPLPAGADASGPTAESPPAAASPAVADESAPEAAESDAQSPPTAPATPSEGADASRPAFEKTDNTQSLSGGTGIAEAAQTAGDSAEPVGETSLTDESAPAYAHEADAERTAADKAENDQSLTSGTLIAESAQAAVGPGDAPEDVAAPEVAVAADSPAAASENLLEAALKEADAEQPASEKADNAQSLTSGTVIAESAGQGGAAGDDAAAEAAIGESSEPAAGDCAVLFYLSQSSLHVQQHLLMWCFLGA